MKSIREWIMENDNINSTVLKNVMGSTSTKINNKMKMMLRPKLEQVVKSFEEENPMDLLRDIIAISVSVIGDMNGSRITTDKILDIIHNLPEEEEKID
jgi:hypothetical protein